MTTDVLLRRRSKPYYNNNSLPETSGRLFTVYL